MYRTYMYSLMQLESRKAVPHASRYPDNSSPRHSPHPKPQPGHLIPQLDGCEVKNHCKLQDHAHFFMSANLRHYLIANKSFSSSKAALAFSFRANGKKGRHLGYRNISLLKIRRRQTSVRASGSEITARKTSSCRRCEVSRRSGLVCNVKKAILSLRVKRE